MKAAALIISLLILISVFLGFAYVKNTKTSQPAVLTVVGEGKVNAKPDLVRFTVTYISVARLSADSLAGEKTKRQEIVALLVSQGVESKDIQAAYPKVSPAGTTADNLVYQTTNTMDVSLKALNNFDSLVNKLYQRNDVSISNTIFTTNNPREIEDKAITNALTDGKARAQKMAAASGAKLGKLVSVAGAQTQAVGTLTREVSLINSGASPSASLGNIELTRNVTLVYELD